MQPNHATTFLTLPPLRTETTRQLKLEIRRARYVGSRRSAEGWVWACWPTRRGAKAASDFPMCTGHLLVETEEKRSDMWVWRRRTASGFVFLHLRAIGGCCFAGSRVYCSVVVHSGLSTCCRWARRRELARICPLTVRESIFTTCKSRKDASFHPESRASLVSSIW